MVSTFVLRILSRIEGTGAGTAERAA
jgi:hypothetical protein